MQRRGSPASASCGPGRGLGQKGPLSCPAAPGRIVGLGGGRAVSLPGAPWLARQGRELCSTAARSRRSRASSAPRCTCIRGARCATRSAPTSVRWPAAAPDLLRDEGQLHARGAADLRAPAAASTSSRAANSSACSPPAASRQDRVLRRRQDARGHAPRAAGRRALLQRRERGRARAAVALAVAPGHRAPVSLRVNPDVDAGRTPTSPPG